MKVQTSYPSARMKKVGRTRIRTEVSWIRTNGDNHYTIQPADGAVVCTIVTAGWVQGGGSCGCSGGLGVALATAVVRRWVRTKNTA